MTEQARVVQDSVDRAREVVRSLDKEFRKLQKRVDTQRRVLEREASKRLIRFVKDVRENPVIKRAEALQKDASRQVERGVENVLGAFQIASKSDLQRIDRKLNQINRKLKEIETSQGLTE